MTDLEVGFSARNETEFNELLRSLEAFRLVNVEAHHFDRARRVQRSLAAAGLEGRKVPDLIIAAVAESESPTVLH
jgi:predicted nucleic acid-binding protein